jgi:protein-tyrosine phosphatase
MTPLVDMHVHLLAGLDDGPRTWDDALAMCRMAHAQGTQMAAATAHQNERWSEVTPGRIREAVTHLAGLLRAEGIPLTVLPCAEVMAHIDMETSWAQSQLLSVADRGQFLLVEMPHRVFVDLRSVVGRFRQKGLRVILAHPERHPEWLHEPGAIEEMITLGCLVQVSSSSVTAPASAADERALKSWFKRGCVHLLGSDGHSPRKRGPFLAEAYGKISRWVGAPAADRICNSNGVAVLQGLPLRTAAPEPKRSWWAFWAS